ncbi:DUF6603 domain-containing protein [Paenibacillus polymyxa]|uniref:DUF6603 domain-containing protein n=1 Tax=Paenibacillus polymyxa TaxID=1406 RepID=UPI003216B8CB
MSNLTVQVNKNVLQFIEEYLHLPGTELPDMPKEIGSIELKDIVTQTVDHYRVARAKEINNLGEFELFAELDDATGKYKYAWIIQFNPNHYYTMGDAELFGRKLSELGFIKILLHQLIFSNDTINTNDVDTWNRIIQQELGADGLLFPIDRLDEGVRLQGSLSLGSVTSPVNLFLGFGSNSLNIVDDTSVGMNFWLSGPDFRREVWYECQYTFGPLTLRRIGMKYRDGDLYILLDASLSISGVKLALDGLGVKTSIWRWSPSYYLDGMMLAYNISPLLMSGSLLEDRTASKKYSGSATVEAFGRIFSAIGSYTDRGVPSLFIYVRTNEPLGGPPYFYVEGLGFGFGINKRFIEPSLDDAINVPLLKELTPDQAIRALENKDRPWISDEIGSNWLAVGIDFTTFKFIKSKMLLIGQFGKGFEMILLGKSTLELPDHQNRFVFIETLLKGHWKPDEGFVGVKGKINPNSYLFNKDCRLEGEYAGWFWYQGDHEGDFIISAGGYHPQFRKPDHYPDLARINVNWPLNWGNIKGTAYFALTPSEVMSGGSLELTYGGGDIKAWLTAHANVLVEWKPFFFDASFGVNVGASIRLHSKYIGSWTWSGEIGADFKLWGQPTGGEVHLGNKYISLTISYGANKPKRQEISQDEFIDMLPGKAELPDKKEHLVRIRPKKGLVRQLENVGNEWIVRPHELQFAIETSIPLLHVSSEENEEIPVKPDLSDVPGIRPCGVKEIKKSLLSLTMKLNDKDESMSNFVLIPNESGVPEALWGSPDGPGGPQSSTLRHTMGVTGYPKDKEPSNTPVSLDLQKKYELEAIATCAGVPSIERTHNEGIPDCRNTSITLIHDTLSNVPIVMKRNQAVDILNKAGIFPRKMDEVDDMTNLAQNAIDFFHEPPLVLWLPSSGGGRGICTN